MSCTNFINERYSYLGFVFGPNVAAWIVVCVCTEGDVDEIASIDTSAFSAMQSLQDITKLAAQAAQAAQVRHRA